MSMYDLAMGDGHQADRWDLLRQVIGNPNVGRYRDSWVEKDAAGV